MPDALKLLAAALCAVAGMGWLALAMETHWEQVCGDTPCLSARRMRLRILGALALAVSLALCLIVDHPSIAALVWVMVVGAAALIVALTLTWRAHWLRGLLWIGKGGQQK